MELFIFNQDEQPLTVISEDTGLVETHYRIEVNSVPTEPFSFTVEADQPTAAHVKEENKVVFKDHEGDWRLMTIKEVDDSNSMDGPTTIAICEPTFLAELNDHIVVERRFVNQTSDVALEAAVNGTRWQASIEVELGQATTNFYYISSTEAIWETIETWGGEFKDVVELDEETNEIKGCYVKIIQRLGKEQGQRFEIDHNTTEIGRTVLSYPKTALYGRGSSLEVEDDEGEHTGGYTRYIDFADVEWSVANGNPVDKPLGQKWVGRDEDRLSMGYYDENGNLKHRFGIFSNQDYEDPEELLWATWEAVQKANQVEVNYRLSVNLFNEKVSLGDTSQAIDRVFARPIEIQTRIIALEYDLMDIENTMVAEMGQFLDLGDNRLDDLEREVEGIKNRPPKQIIDEGSYPDRKPSTPVNLEAYGGMEVIQLYWQYADELFIKHYEVYGSRTEDFVPDTQHLLWRGDVSAFSHTVGTDEVWYYRVRAVNYHGRPSDWSVQVRAATHRVLTEDIMWGPELAERMRELHRVSDIIGENGVDFDQISKEAKDLLEQQARIYTDAEVESARNNIMSDLDERTERLDNRIADLNERADGLVSRADDIDDLLYEHGDRFVNMETEIDDIEGRIFASIEEIERIDDTVTSNSLELEAHAKSISAKLDELTYTRDKEGILESIEQNTLEIEATAEGLQLNADAISKVDGVVEGHSAQLNFLNDEISTKVEESFVRDAIGDIEIGDRNLLLGTSKDFKSISFGGWTSSNIYKVEVGEGKVLKPGDTFTVSGYVKSGNKRTAILINVFDDYGDRIMQITSNYIEADQEGYAIRSYAIPDSTAYMWVLLRHDSSDAPLDEKQYKEFVLVKGNKVGNWGLAPEDIIFVQENHNTAIDQNSRKIALQSDSIINMDGLIKDAQAEISVMSEEITNRVTKTIFDDESDYLRRNIAETRNFAEGIEQTVSSIQIGGRNLASINAVKRWASGLWSRDGYKYTLTNANGNANVGLYIDRTQFENSTEYAVSFKIKKVSGTVNTLAGHRNGVASVEKVYKDGALLQNANWNSGDKNYDNSEEVHEYVIHFTTEPNAVENNNHPFYIQPNRPGYGESFEVEIWDLQLEKGNKKTEWQPAYEDADQRMSVAESSITQLADDMRFKVDVDGIVSEINLNREGIRLKGNLIHLDGLSLIDDAVIQNAHIANGTIERGKLERAIIGTAQVENGAITNAKIASLNADKINAANLQAISANMGTLRSGRLLSNNNNMDLNLNTGNLTMRNAHFTLGSGARIEFTNVSNRIQYRDTKDGTVRSAGFGVGKSLQDYPFAYSGTTGAANLDTLSEWYSGAMWHTTRAIADGAANSISGFRFQLRNRAVGWDKGIEFDFNGNPTIRPFAHGTHDLGAPLYRYRRIYVDNVLGWRTVYISNPTANRGFAIDTDHVDGHNPSIYGQYPADNNYNIGRSNRYMTYVYTNTVRANYLHGALQGNSARKFKKNEDVMDLADSLEFIRNAKIVTFDWIRDESMKFNKDNPQTIYDRQVGFILDDLKMRNDYLVKNDEETIKKDNILFMHQHVIQDNVRRLDRVDEEMNWQSIEYQYINNEVKKLKDENKALKKRVKTLEEMVA